MTLYADFFREVNFRLPMSKFIGEVLTGYGLHISQINALGLHRLTHFEFICRANRVEQTFEKFNTFHFVTYTGGFYSFNSHNSGVKPYSRGPTKSLHDWKQKLFCIRRSVIPIDMHYRLESEGIPRVNMSIDFTEQEWYTVLTRKVTSIIQFEERALVAAGMSMLWAPRNPRGFPVYGYRGKAGYSLMNVFDPKASGAMVVASLPEGRPLWLDHIRDTFLHPSNESMVNYANTILGDDGEDGIGFDVNPTREEPILHSSDESDDESFHLICCSSRAGPKRGPSEEPAADHVDTPVVDLQAGDTTHVEARKKKKEDKTWDKKAEEPVAEIPRKRPSNSYFLDYVVVSDTLSGLDAGAKRQSRDPDDDSTLTEMTKKRNLLEDKKKELHAQKETTAAPSEPEIDLGVFSKKTGNRLEKIFKSASSSCAASKHGHSRSNFDISKIPPPASPPSKPLDLSPPHPDSKGKGKGKGKGKEGGVEVEQVGKVLEDVAAGAGRDESHAEGTITKCVRSSGGGGTSGVPQSPEFHCVQGGSWTSHNPTCDMPLIGL
ncbi:hypothetical protein Hanom_Chr12g01129871 [Helianthus anomalus]